MEKKKVQLDKADRDHSYWALESPNVVYHCKIVVNYSFTVTALG